MLLVVFNLMNSHLIIYSMLYPHIDNHLLLLTVIWNYREPSADVCLVFFDNLRLVSARVTGMV